MPTKKASPDLSRGQLKKAIQAFEALPEKPARNAMDKTEFLSALAPHIQAALTRGYSYAKLAKMISLKTSVDFTGHELKKACPRQDAKKEAKTGSPSQPQRPPQNATPTSQRSRRNPAPQNPPQPPRQNGAA